MCLILNDTQTQCDSPRPNSPQKINLKVCWSTKNGSGEIAGSYVLWELTGSYTSLIFIIDSHSLILHEIIHSFHKLVPASSFGAFHQSPCYMGLLTPSPIDTAYGSNGWGWKGGKRQRKIEAVTKTDSFRASK